MNTKPLYNEEVLVRQAAAGDAAAFESIFDHYWSRVFGMAFKVTKSPDQAKDLAQDIFFKLWAGRHRMAELESFSNYLFIVARNTIADFIRSSVLKESNKEYLSEYFFYEQYNPHEVLEQKEFDRSVMDAIEGLPPQLKHVFQLRRVEGLTYEQIGKRLNITAMSSKTYMVRALAMLRKKLGRGADTILILLIIMSKHV